jgi:hypothetical protein
MLGGVVVQERTKERLSRSPQFTLDLVDPVEVCLEEPPSSAP